MSNISTTKGLAFHLNYLESKRILGLWWKTLPNEPGMIVTCSFRCLELHNQPKVAGIQSWHAQACKQKTHLQLHKADLSQTELHFTHNLSRFHLLCRWVPPYPFCHSPPSAALTPVKIKTPKRINQESIQSSAVGNSIMAIRRKRRIHWCHHLSKPL